MEGFFTGMSEIEIRPMGLEDLEAAHQIDRRSFTLPWPPRAYRYELVENPDSLLWVAEARLPDDSRRVVGLIVIWLILDEAHVATIAVDPEYRGRGIAGRLLAVGLEASIEKGMALATLEVRQHNTAAQNLYRRFGFKVVGRRPRYYKDNNEDALIMTLDKLDDGYRNWLQSGAWQRRRDGVGGPDAPAGTAPD